MMYKATDKFKDLDRSNSHHGLEKSDYEALWYRRAVDNVPQRLIDDGFVAEIKKKAKVKDGSTN